MESRDHKADISSGKKACIRGGSFLKTVFLSKIHKLSGEDCCKLMDYYGIRSSDVVKLAYSHSYEIDEEDFIKSLEKRDAYAKTVRPIANG